MGGLGALYTDEDGERKPMVMGCYGIGVSRAMAAIVEEHHDEKGIIWPQEAAPFDIVVLLLDADNAELAGIAEDLTVQLEEAGYEAMLDDRDERPGVKFKDADLIGYPINVVIGRRTEESGEVEVRRRDGEEQVVAVSEALSAVQKLAAPA